MKNVWFKDNTTEELVKFTPKLFYFTKLRGLLHFLPQLSTIFTQIYLPYLWHLATLDAAAADGDDDDDDGGGAAAAASVAAAYDDDYQVWHPLLPCPVSPAELRKDAILISK